MQQQSQLPPRFDPHAPLGTYGAVESHSQTGANQQGLLIQQTPAKDPARLAPMTEEDAAETRAKPSLKDLPALMMPWLLYGMILFATALMEGQTLSILAAVTCFTVSGAFIIFSRGLPWRMLAMTCIIMSGVGYAMGSYDKAKYLYPYYFYNRSPSYSEVDPQSAPGSVADAGFLEFNAATHVDTTRSVGFVSDSTWCAAPIVSSDLSDTAGFWAVGKDCCRRQGLFRCGDATNRTIRSGVVIKDASPILQDDIPQYLKAAEMAAGTYGINMPRNPIFVRWSDTSENNTQWYWDSAVNFAMTAALLFLFAAPCFLLVLTCAGYSLFGGKSGPGWHPEKVDLMTFGFDWSSRVYPNYVQQDLMYSRSFWSGEVIEDYAFHIANRHVYLSCLFCHPVHPYQKWQRLVVALTTTIVLLFSTAALTVWVGHGAMRVVYIIGMFLALRNSLKLMLMTFGIEGPARELEEGHVIGGKNVRAITAKEVMILLGYAFVTLLVAFACSSIISTAHTSLGSALRSNIDTLDYIYILDFLADLMTPFLGHDAFQGVWTLGFFGRWCRERDEFESAKIKLQQHQNNQWTSLGAEVLGVGSQHRVPPGARNLHELEVGDQYVLPHGVMSPTTSNAPMFSQFAVKKKR